MGDSDGEWVELFNPNAETVNLRGWRLADLGTDNHAIAADVFIPPGGYVVLARNGDPTVNGGVNAAYVYTGISLANGDDELLLIAPDGTEMDRVVWGGGLRVTAGASLERAGFAVNSGWQTATQPWLGSAGDVGSPGGPATPPSAATATPTTVAPGASWPLAPVESQLQIDEVAPNGSNEEYIALVNVGKTPLALDGYLVGDAQRPGLSEGMYALPGGVVLGADTLFVIARNGAGFRERWQRAADAQIEPTDPAVPTLERRADLANGALALADGGDEVVLLNAAGELVDALAYDNGDFAGLGLTQALPLASNASLQRVPGAFFPAVSDLRHRFLSGPPSPFVSVSLPTPLDIPLPQLDQGLLAVWGSLGGHSNFSPGYGAPPHYTLAAAATHGLDFVALADPQPHDWLPVAPPLTLLPAWTWYGGDDRAVVYSDHWADLLDRASLTDFLAAGGYTAQWQGDEAFGSPNIVALAADRVSAPENLSSLYASWIEVGAALLPAGNAEPPLPDRAPPAPAYTGLAVATVDAGGVREALSARRGWLTNSPGLWLTLRAEQDGSHAWMGNSMTPGNDVTLHVHYGDRSGETAGLAIWQNDRPVRQLDTPTPDGRWSVALPAAPGSLLFAVAAQMDGGFAVTAPLLVLPGAGGNVLINEVLPSAWSDLNGDGDIDGDDEFIELYNPGDDPVSLVGWQVADQGEDGGVGKHFTFGSGRFVTGRGFLKLWRKDTRLNLNNDGDALFLLRPDGSQADSISWEKAPGGGLSIARLPDGGDWQSEGDPTPGQPNRRGEPLTWPFPDPTPLPSSPPSDSDDDEETRLDLGEGQAGGSPGSVAFAKRWGLEVWVEFRAQVVAPPGLFNDTIYVADPAGGALAGIGVNVFLWRGDFPPLEEGDWVIVRGVLRSFRGEMEVQMDAPEQIWRIGPGEPLAPLPVTVGDIGEKLEGRLVTFEGVVSGYQGDSIFLSDPDNPDAPAVRVTVRSSLGWRRPYVVEGDRWRVTGVVSQFAREAPWNGGYRVLVRYEGADLARVQ